MKRRGIWFAVLAALAVIAGSICVIVMLDKDSGPALNVDSKCELITEHITWRGEIIESEGSYDPDTGMYHYRFVWQYNYKLHKVLTYDADVDLTIDTLNLIQISDD